MKVQLLVGLSNGKQAGDVLECSEDEAGRMIASRFALPFVEDKTERAVKADPVETRVKKAKNAR
jgi:hypothetical protein